MRKVLIAFTVLLISLPLYGNVYAKETTPDFALTNIEGREFSIANFRGTPVILVFVATRVIFSKMHVSILYNISRCLEDDVILILIGISNETLWVGGDTDEQLRSFKEDCGFEGIVARDTKGVTEEYNVTYIPTTFLIDQDGYILRKHVGVVRAKEHILSARTFEELVNVIPEFSSALILLFGMGFVTLIIAVTKRRR